MSDQVLRQGVTYAPTDDPWRQATLPAGTDRDACPEQIASQERLFTSRAAFDAWLAKGKGNPTGDPPPSVIDLDRLDPDQRARWEVTAERTGPPDPAAPADDPGQAGDEPPSWDDVTVADMRAFLDAEDAEVPAKARKSDLSAMIEAMDAGPGEVVVFARASAED